MEALIAVTVVFLAMAAGTWWVLTHQVVRCPADLVLIVSGMKQSLPDGSNRGYRLVLPGERAFVMPLVERVDRLSLASLTVDREVDAGPGGPSARAVATVRVSREPDQLRAAVERFMGREAAEVELAIGEVVETAVQRALGSARTGDRAQLGAEVMAGIAAELEPMGFEVETMFVR